MGRNSSESDDRGSRRNRYSKAMTPLPPLPSSMSLSVFQGNLPPQQQHHLHPNHHHLLSSSSPSQILHHHPPSVANMRTPVAWSLRDANLSRPASNHALPFSSPLNQQQLQHQLHHQQNHHQSLLSQHQMQMQQQQQHRLHHYNTSSSSSHNNMMPVVNVNSRYMPSSSSAASSQVSRNHPRNNHHHQHHVAMNGQSHRSQNSKQQQQQSQSQRPSSPSATTTSSDDREEVPIVRHPRRHLNHGRQMRAISSDRRSVMSRASRTGSQMPSHHLVPYDAYAPHPGITMGTLRSTKSVPSLAIHSHHDVNGCPVHGGPHPGAYSVIHGPIYSPGDMSNLPPRPRTAAGSIIDVRTLVPPTPGSYSVVNFAPEKKLYPMSLPLPPAPMSMMQTGTLYRQSAPHPAIITVNPQTALPTKLTLQHHPLSAYYEDASCCKGHLIVLWIILGVVTIGVISGIVLGVTMN